MVTETFVCEDCGKEFVLDLDIPLNKQVPDDVHTWGNEDNTLRHITLEDLFDGEEEKSWHNLS